MKKRFAVLVLLSALLLTLAGCMPGGSAQQNAVAKVDLVLPTKAGAESGQETIDLPEIFDKDYEDTIEGLCQYLEDNYCVADEKVQMSYDVIDAVDGYRYLFKYNKASVQLEVYEFDLENLSAATQENLANVKANDKLKVIEKEIDAVISDNGKYVMVYQDGNPDETNRIQQERATDLFKAFKK